MTNDVKKSAGITFTFGDPEPVLEGFQIQELMESWWNGQYYEMPFNVLGLSKAIRSNPYLPSALQFKKNQLLKYFVPCKKLKLQQADRLFTDFVTFGNAYLERFDNYFGEALGYRTSIAKHTRRMSGDQCLQILSDYTLKEFRKGYVCHITENDINQEIYGVPEYLAVIQSALLNESATLFRRKYYNNGSHTGYILYLNDPNMDERDVDAISEAIKQSKGPGNFKNLFIHAPNGKDKGVQIIPVNEVATKDDFSQIKAITRDDILGGMRVNPVLMGIMPNSTGGLGSPKEASDAYFDNEIIPLQRRIQYQVNDWAQEEIIRFDNPKNNQTVIVD